jgi:tRNA U34 2-thiouridine synthase MnmA/TrmU
MVWVFLNDSIIFPIPASYFQPKSGAIIDKLTGKRIGEHSGLWNFTIGQNARISGMPEKLFVVSKDLEHNTIYVVPGR